MKRNVIISFVFVLIAGIWLGYGILAGNSTPSQHETLDVKREQAAQLRADSERTAVRVRSSSAMDQIQTVTLRGRTQNKRTVVIRAQVGGKVESAPFERGDLVTEGQALCVLEKREHEARIKESQDRLREAVLIYDGRKRLDSLNLNSDLDIASAKAQVTAAERQAVDAQLRLERSVIRAPFNGYVEVAHAFEGDLLSANSPCVTLLDLDPMKILAQVQEDIIHQLKLGSSARAELPSGEELEGVITFLGRGAEMATRTFTLEVTVPNPDYTIRSGLTAKLDIPLGSFRAHKVNASQFVLDDQGQIGIHILENTDTVRFYPVTIVREDSDGVWVAGLPDEIVLITVGQRYVTDSELVEATFESEINNAT